MLRRDVFKNFKVLSSELLSAKTPNFRQGSEYAFVSFLNFLIWSTYKGLLVTCIHVIDKDELHFSK